MIPLVFPSEGFCDLFSEQLSHLCALQQALGIQQHGNPLATEGTLIFVLLLGSHSNGLKYKVFTLPFSFLSLLLPREMLAKHQNHNPDQMLLG